MIRRYTCGTSESMIAQCAIAGALHITQFREYGDVNDYARVTQTLYKLARVRALKRRRKGTYDLGEAAPWWAQRLREWRPREGEP